MRGLIVFALLLGLNTSAVWAFDYPDRPNPEMTDGDLCNKNDPDFVEYRYAEKIPYCNRNVWQEQKRRIFEQYGIPEHCRSQYTIDHLIPLALGGSNAPNNLWPEHRNVKATRKYLEQNLYFMMENGEITQRKAIKIILEDKNNPSPSTPAPCR